MKRLLLLLSVAIFLGVVVAIASPHMSAGLSDNGVREIKIDNFSFAPDTVEIPAGAQVRWTNHDDIPHNVVSEEKLFRSKLLDTDDQFIFTFSKPGTYRYFCSLHPKMTATIVVH